jgi:arginine N-succinyltransferase
MPEAALIRPVTLEDADGLLALADLLDTMNLPDDPAAVRQLIEDSVASFAGQPRGEGGYTLIAELDGRIVGTASLIARHGSPRKPHYYLELADRPVRSPQLEVSYIRHLLRLGKDESPRTELGGLVVHPEARGLGLGKLLLAARLLLIAARRAWFSDRLIAELLPPLRVDGGNAFWDAVGGALTGLEYYRADRLCRMDKSFIEDLFPRGDVILELLPKEAQAVVGTVGPHTMPVRALLERIGFSFLRTIDPFDGGPHFGASREAVGPIQHSRELVVLDTAPTAPGEPHILMHPNSHRFLVAPCAVVGRGLRLAENDRARLGAEAGDGLWVMPLDW